jgi:hypothetical protein
MYTKTIKLDSGLDMTAFPTHLRDQLRRIKARTAEVHQNCVSFTGGPLGFEGNRWDILVPFGFGDLTV